MTAGPGGAIIWGKKRGKTPTAIPNDPRRSGGRRERRKMKRSCKDGAPQFGERAWAEIRRIKALGKRAAFTLYVSEAGAKRGLKVVGNGRGADSEYRAVVSPSGEIPAWAQPESTYVARDQGELAQILAMFAEHPELFSKSGDALDEAWTVPFDDGYDSWGAVGNDR